MKLAVAGKGGSGKTTVAGTLARTLARRGVSVLAVDGDTNPNLGMALGFGVDVTEELIAAREALDADPQPQHETTIEGVIRRFGADGPDGVRLLQVSRIDHPVSGCP